MNRIQTDLQAANTSVAEMALQELQDRIEASGLEASYAGLVCDLCVGQVSLEKAFTQIHEKAMEEMVGLLDASVLNDEVALGACLDQMPAESERRAWGALERGTEAIREGPSLREGTALIQDNGYLN